MAKKKAPPKPEPRPTALTIRGSNEWRTWVQNLAQFCRTDTTKLVDMALVELAKSRGFGEKPPER